MTIETADMSAQEVLSRNLGDRGAVVRYAGLAGAPALAAHHTGNLLFDFHLRFGDQFSLVVDLGDLGSEIVAGQFLAADFAADPGRRDALDAVVDRFQEGVEGDALLLIIAPWGNLIRWRLVMPDAR